MATVLRNTSVEIGIIAAAHNDLKAQVGAGASYHLDAYESPIASTNATDLPSALTLVNEIVAVFTAHSSDLLAHKVAGTALASTAKATDLASAIARANDVKAKHNTDRASATIHYNADATDVTSSADATDLASLLTLANELKSDINAHMASAPAAKSLRVVSA
jgi:hypothetical protein